MWEGVWNNQSFNTSKSVCLKIYKLGKKKVEALTKKVTGIA
jgi:hypothetical protein